MYTSYKHRKRQKRNQRAIRARNARAAIAYREQIELERQQQVTEQQQQIQNVVMQQVSECTEVEDVMESSEHKNIYLKFSGYNYILGENKRWDFPYSDAMWVYKEAYNNFGSSLYRVV